MSEPRQHSGRNTLADLISVTGGEPTHELSDGHLLVAAPPPPGWQHGAIAMIVGSAIHAFVTRHRLGRVVTCDTWFVLRRKPDTVRGPDVAFVRQARCQYLSNPEAPFEGAPDLAAEVISPGDRPACVADKVRDYQRAGTRVIWLIEARAARVTVIDHAGQQIFGHGDTLTCPDLLQRDAQSA